MNASLEGPDWSAEYDKRVGQYEKLRGEVEFALGNALADKKTQSISVRAKEQNSFVEKIQRKEYEDPFGEMPDIVGARIVCLFLEDIDEVESIIRETFEVKSKEDKTALSAPDTFSYRSVHFECAIKDEHSGPHYDGIKNLTFEIQVRTILQDAWAVVEHALAYKGSSSIPIELKRDFSALVGLFHLADKIFQQLRHGIEKSELDAATTVDALGDETKEVEVPIDRGTLKAYLRRIYPNRLWAKDAHYSSLVDDLAAADIRTLGQLIEILEGDPERVKVAESDEIGKGPYFDLDGKRYKELGDTGFARVVAGMVLEDFRDSRKKFRFVKMDE
ncbi:hypothetical protein [Nocardia sp. NPDC019395]|uniref:GTP pyrophosphokinase n=1 Tax=Nocardia sp. NPDC019395 TaxID=3154686 RepID=UPI0033D21D21